MSGFPFTTLDAELNEFADGYDKLKAKLNPPPASLLDWLSVLSAAGEVVEGLVGLGETLSTASTAELKTVGSDIIKYLGASYVAAWLPITYHVLVLLTLVEEFDQGAVVDQNGNYLRVPVSFPELRLDRLGPLLRDPAGTLKTEYGLENGLTDAPGTADKLFPRIANILRLLDVNAVYGIPPDFAQKFGTNGAALASHMLTIFERVASSPTTTEGFGATFSLDQALGLVVRPVGTLSFTDTFSDWAVDVEAEIGIEGVAVSTTGVTVPAGPPIQNANVTVTLAKVPNPENTDSEGTLPTLALGSTSGTRLEVSQLQVSGNAVLQSGSIDYGVGFDIGSASLIVSGGDGDGFLSEVLPSNSRVDFDFGVAWSRQQGLRFHGGGSLDLTLPVTVSIAGTVKIEAIHLTVLTNGSEVQISASASASIEIGPVEVSADRVGLLATLDFPDAGGNLGPLDLSLGFKPPSGLGIAIDAGPISGGGALTFDSPNNRYFGALELSIYSVSVKAFGVIETKLPTGPGYSFLIIISAEFTPIQLGFGFTLNGVGGLLGINRSVDSNGLLTMIKTGQLDNVLFPTDVIDNAPAILNDVETLFPPTSGHYVFGPLAKLGWGTPTLVDGELGLIIEYPGPVLTIIGTVHAALPKQDDAVVELNLDVGGVLDFPNKKFSLDASLHDSRVGDYPISGDMAMRMNWGQNPNFALSLGGFNPHYNPPAGFPKLKPISVDLGSNGNPSIVLSGYMALTSNTAQLGAKLQASISKDGASLSGTLSFDALFVFSPFSFEADIEGGVSASIDGYGISLDFHGTLSGPSPWHLAGKVCISLWFFSACADFSTTLGGTSQPTLPGVDPWTGSLPANADGTQTVPGLQPALLLTANWGGNPPPGSFQAVTLVAPPQGTAAQAPIDPLGSATFRQKAVPLDLQITAFAGTAPQPVRNLHVSNVMVGSQPVANPPTVNDYFAPGQYQKMKDADKLSSQSFVQLPGGFTVSSDALTFGPQSQVGLIYQDVTFAAPVGSPPTITPDAYGPSQTHVTTVTGQSAATKAGLRNSALAAFVDPKVAPLVNLANELYTIANIANLVGATGFQTNVTNIPRPVATTALAAAAAASATARQTLQVAPMFFVQPSTFVL